MEKIEKTRNNIIKAIKKETKCWVCHGKSIGHRGEPGKSCYECGSTGYAPFYDIDKLIELINEKFDELNY